MKQIEDEKQYVMMSGSQYLTLNPVTWMWHLSDHLEDLQIWDYHHDLECMPIPEIEGMEIRYVELTEEEISIVVDGVMLFC